MKIYLIFMENIKKNFLVKLINLISRVFWSGLFLIFWPTMRRDEMAIFFVVHIFLRLNFVVGKMCYKNDIFLK